MKQFRRSLIVFLLAVVWGSGCHVLAGYESTREADAGGDTPDGQMLSDGGDASSDSLRPIAEIAFTVQPAAAFATVPFGQQPVIEARDATGTRVPSSADVTLSAAPNAGSLVGTTTVTMVDGIARFTNVGFEDEQQQVTLVATSGNLTVESQPFDVGALPPGACLRASARLKTAGGGCLDQGTGLVWSAISPETMSWNAAVWDAARSGSAPPDQHDAGWTNDYDPSGRFTSGPDTSANAYCHNLAEAGRRDWRLPALGELTALQQALVSDGDSPYPGDDRNLVWASTAASTSSLRRGVADLSTVNTASTHSNDETSVRAICVRGPRPAAHHIEIRTAPAALQVSSTRMDPPLRVAIVGPDAESINAEGIELRLVTDNTALGGTPLVHTDAWGEATLDAWTAETIGPAVIRIEGPGPIASATLALTIGAFPNTCASANDRFVTAEGGCHDQLTGLVWSYVSPAALNWHHAIWDSESPTAALGGNIAPDAHDGARTNDYAPTSDDQLLDQSSVNYCHELVEGGFRDWRVPTPDELIAVFAGGAGAPAQFAYNTDHYFFSGLAKADTNRATVVQLTTGAVSATPATANHRGVCVRGAAL